MKTTSYEILLHKYHKTIQNREYLKKRVLRYEH